MLSPTITVAGLTYVRSRDAARASGISPDYASRLARSGQIAGHQTNGLWFVNVGSLKDFLVAQERQKEVWRSVQAQLRREEQRRAGHPAAA